MPDTGFQPTNIVLRIISSNIIVPDNSTMQVPEDIEIVDTYDLEVGDGADVEVVSLI